MRSAKLALSLFFILATTTGLALAQPEEPAFYRVGNLPGGDKLKIRTSPSARSQELGELGSGAHVLATGKRTTNGATEWFEVNFEGNLGWASSRYLVPQKVKRFSDTLAPVAGSCGGWEPPWDVTWNNQRMVFKSPDFLFSQGTEGQAEESDFSKITTAEGHTAPNILEFASRTTGTRFRLIPLDDAMCSLAGEAPHYQSGLLLVEKNGSLTAYYGCCDPADEAIVRNVNAQMRCKVTDPTGTPLNVRRAPDGPIINQLKNGREVFVLDTAQDDRGRSWAYVEGNYKGKRREWGWVFREFISCF